MERISNSQGLNKMLKSFKLSIQICLLLSMLLPWQVAQAISNLSVEEEEEVINDVVNDIDQLTNQLKALDNYKLSFRFSNMDEARLLVDGEIIGSNTNGDSRWLFDIYEYDQEGKPNKQTYDLINYREFGLAYIKTIQLLEETKFFDQVYFNENIKSQFATYSNYYVPISGSELESIVLNNSVYENLLYLPNSELINQINPENVYQLNDSIIIDMERLEIPRGLFQNSGSLNLDYYLNIDINEIEDRHVDYDVVTSQRFNVSENSNGISFRTKIESNITDSLMTIAPSIEDAITDYEWESQISTNHVTDKLTKATITINPETTTYSATLTGLYEQFMLNIFSNQTADIQSFNYRLELTISPTRAEVPNLGDIQTMTLAEFSYLLESSLTKSEQSSTLQIERLR